MDWLKPKNCPGFVLIIMPYFINRTMKVLRFLKGGRVCMVFFIWRERT